MVRILDMEPASTEAHLPPRHLAFSSLQNCVFPGGARSADNARYITGMALYHGIDAAASKIFLLTTTGAAEEFLLRM